MNTEKGMKVSLPKFQKAFLKVVLYSLTSALHTYIQRSIQQLAIKLSYTL